MIPFFIQIYFFRNSERKLTATGVVFHQELVQRLPSTTDAYHDGGVQNTDQAELLIFRELQNKKTMKKWGESQFFEEKTVKKCKRNWRCRTGRRRWNPFSAAAHSDGDGRRCSCASETSARPRFYPRPWDSARFSSPAWGRAETPGSQCGRHRWRQTRPPQFPTPTRWSEILENKITTKHNIKSKNQSILSILEHSIHKTQHQIKQSKHFIHSGTFYPQNTI